MTLYEIESQIIACLDLETGEITDAERLDALQMEREAKLENIALYIKNLAAEADAIKLEEKNLAERRKAKESRADGLRQYLTDALGGAKFESARVKVSFRKSASVEVQDADALLAFLENGGFSGCIEYLPPKIKLKPVGDLIKAGQALPGVAIIEKQNIQIR